ncbi:hypothetical protein EJP617_25830 [Erwinia sp. Ejp617]|nr:hypothetical protein EJP617_25830 [Erwinia sp. Ejp617]
MSAFFTRDDESLRVAKGEDPLHMERLALSIFITNYKINLKKFV